MSRGGELVVARLFLPPPAVSPSFLSANQNTDNKPCRGETPALVTSLLNGVSAGICSQSPTGSGVWWRAHKHTRSCELAPMVADRRGEVNSQRHSGQTWQKGISDLSIICLGMIDGWSDFFLGFLAVMIYSSISAKPSSLGTLGELSHFYFEAPSSL